MKLDRAEKLIIDALQRDGRVSNVDLAAAVGLSESPCYRRVKALAEGGVIEGYTAVVNQRALGLQVTAFMLVSLQKQDDRKQRQFIAAVEAEEHIVECHAMSGSHDFLLKVVARSMDHYSEIAMGRILKFPGVENIESNFSLQVVKRPERLPV